MTLRTVATAVATAALALGLAACGEKPQTIGEKTAGTTVTRDTKPWQGDPLPTQAQFTRGDKASWENALKTRMQAQNEYIRVGGK